MALPLGRLPRYLILDPVSTVRLEVALARPGGELDVALQNPAPGRSFLLLVGPPGGPVLERLRLSGRARILFGPRDQRPQVLMLANPGREPLVLGLRGRPSARVSSFSRASRPAARQRPAAPRPAGPVRRSRVRWPSEPVPRDGAVVQPWGGPMRRGRPKG